MPNTRVIPTPTAPKVSGRIAAFQKMAKDRPSHEAMEWLLVSPRLIVEMISYAQACGDAVMFGQTRDGSALILTVYSGQQRFPYYAGDVAQMEDIIRGLVVAMGSDVPSVVCDRINELLRPL